MGAERNWNVNGSISKVSYDQDATGVRRSSSLRKSVSCPYWKSFWSEDSTDGSFANLSNLSRGRLGDSRKKGIDCWEFRR